MGRLVAWALMKVALACFRGEVACLYLSRWMKSKAEQIRRAR